MRVGDRWGICDRAGKFAINPQFDGAGPFRNGLAPIRTGDRWGFVDRKGKLVVNPQFSAVSPFSEVGLALVLSDGNPRDFLISTEDQAVFDGGGGKWGFIDTKGKLVISPQFQSAGPFHGKLALVQVTSAAWAYVDSSGRIAWSQSETTEGNAREEPVPSESRTSTNDTAAQKVTVASMRNVGTAMMSWMTDQLSAAAAGQSAEPSIVRLEAYTQVSSGDLQNLLVPMYISELPERDGWGHR